MPYCKMTSKMIYSTESKKYKSILGINENVPETIHCMTERHKQANTDHAMSVIKRTKIGGFGFYNRVK